MQHSIHTKSIKWNLNVINFLVRKNFISFLKYRLYRLYIYYIDYIDYIGTMYLSTLSVYLYLNSCHSCTCLCVHVCVCILLLKIIFYLTLESTLILSLIQYTFFSLLCFYFKLPIQQFFGEDREGGRSGEWQGQILIPGCHPTMIIIRQKE